MPTRIGGKTVRVRPEVFGFELLPMMLAAGSALPGVDGRHLALMLCLSLGLMGIISPYGSGPGPVYATSGYLPARDFWRLGAIFGTVFLAGLIVLVFATAPVTSP